MTRPTLIHIARKAGVSLVIVDTVLNARSGLRAQTIGAVNDAITRLIVKNGTGDRPNCSLAAERARDFCLQVAMRKTVLNKTLIHDGAPPPAQEH